MNIQNYSVKGIYFSPTSTTKQVVEAIVKSIGCQYTITDITLPDTRKVMKDFGDKDLVVIGLPVYSGRIPLIVESYLKGLVGNQTPVILVGVYGNRDYDDMLLEMKDILSVAGFIPISAGAFIGEHSYTTEVATARPSEKDITIAQAFGKASVDLIEKVDLLKLELYVKGNKPYKKRKELEPLGPIINDLCTMCGSCVSACPSGALSMTDRVEVDESLCIQCCSCVKKCPTQSIIFTERIPDFRVFLMENCSEYKDPELFYGIEK